MESDSALHKLSDLNSSCLDELVALANIQAARLLALFTEERKSGLILTKLNPLIKDHSKLLFRIQELQFDLGLVAYQRGTLKEAIAAAAQEKQMTQERLAEAYARVNEIFREHGTSSEIPPDMREAFRELGRKNNAQI